MAARDDDDFGFQSDFGSRGGGLSSSSSSSVSSSSSSFGATQGQILCCMCGTLIAPNSANMCVECLRSRVDITEGIPKQLPIQWCKGCGRYHQPPTAWIDAPLESPRLLTLCLKKLRGLNKVKLVDASFVWTEPHSRRLKVKVTIQREVFSSTILQQSFIVEYIVTGLQCGECQRLQAQDTWTAVAQVRQKVSHKRTFFLVEQLILKHNAHLNTINIKEFPDGLDFFFHTRSHAVKFVEFLQSIVPLRYITAQKLISHDVRSNIYNYKYTFSVEISPVCRDDLVCLPKRVAHAMGSISPLVLCQKVTNVLRLVDPWDLQGAQMTSVAYWQTPFRSIAAREQLAEFVVLDIQRHPSRKTLGKYCLADVTVARASDFGANDSTLVGRTHMGNLLRPGDSVLGFDLTTAVIPDSDIKALGYNGAMPDFVLVKKVYAVRNRRSGRNRHWQLKKLDKEKVALDDMSSRAAREAEVREADQYEQFLQELEEDPELRSKINIYRKDDAEIIAKKRQEELEEDGDNFPEVQLSELLDSMHLEGPPPVQSPFGDLSDDDDE